MDISNFKGIDSRIIDSYRTQIDNMSDSELDALIDKKIPHEDFTDDEIDSLRLTLNSEIRKDRKYVTGYKVLASIAAVLTIAFVLGSVFVYNICQTYDGYDRIFAREITFSTRRGENSIAKLPDGSTVHMSPETTVSYSLSSFFRRERRVSFDGEVRLEVAHDEGKPFILSAGALEITVLGTTFSVLSRDYKDYIEVHLEEGMIEMSHSLSDDSRILHPGETAVVDRNSGKILMEGDMPGYKTSVGSGALFFRSRKLSDIVPQLEVYYGVSFDLDPHSADIVFTGSLPVNCLKDALYILEHTLDLRIEEKGSIILIR